MYKKEKKYIYIFKWKLNNANALSLSGHAFEYDGTHTYFKT